MLLGCLMNTGKSEGLLQCDNGGVKTGSESRETQIMEEEANGQGGRNQIRSRIRSRSRSREPQWGNGGQFQLWKLQRFVGRGDGPVITHPLFFQKNQNHPPLILSLENSNLLCVFFFFLVGKKWHKNKETAATTIWAHYKLNFMVIMMMRERFSLYYMEFISLRYLHHTPFRTYFPFPSISLLLL